MYAIVTVLLSLCGCGIRLPIQTTVLGLMSTRSSGLRHTVPVGNICCLHLQDKSFWLRNWVRLRGVVDMVMNIRAS
jgi:hypothetical protein